MKPAESAKPAESEKIPNHPAKDAKISLCSQKKDLIIFTTICLSCSLFVMIGFYTFFPNDKQPIKLSTNEPIKTNDKTNTTIDDEDDIDIGCPCKMMLNDDFKVISQATFDKIWTKMKSFSDDDRLNACRCV